LRQISNPFEACDDSEIDDLLDMVDQWKFKVHERLKGLTPQQRRAFWSRIGQRARKMGLNVIMSFAESLSTPSKLEQFTTGFCFAVGIAVCPFLIPLVLAIVTGAATENSHYGAISFLFYSVLYTAALGTASGQERLVRSS
jgi:hypothetical protein